MMKKSYLLYLIIPIGLSCTSSYKTLQTPDDVYYSPAFLKPINVKNERSENREVISNTEIINTTVYRSDYDDVYYYRRHRRYYYDNPYYGYKEPSRNISAPRTVNVDAYNNNKTNNNVSPKLGGKPTDDGINSSNSSMPVRTFRRTNGSALGNMLRKIVSGDTYLLPSNSQSNNSSNNDLMNYNRPPSASNSTPSSSSGNSSGSSSAPVRKFEKKN